MHLPRTIVPYFLGLLSAQRNFCLTAIAKQLYVSHDKLTRLLRKKIHWKAILNSLLITFDLSNGYLVTDETDVDKSYASVIQGLSWIFSHRFNRYIYGYHIVVIAWTNGIITIPLGWKIYKKNGKDTKVTMAFNLIKYCIFTLHIKPQGVLFDSFYAAFEILHFLDNNNIKFYTQIPKNRLFEGKQLKLHNKNRPYWTSVGRIRGRILVRIVKHRRKYFMTNDLETDPKEVRKTYSMRWRIEEVFRFIKQKFGFEECECRSLQAQSNHFGSCLALYAILQDIVLNTGLNVYAIKERATLGSEYLNLVAIRMNLLYVA